MIFVNVCYKKNKRGTILIYISHDCTYRLSELIQQKKPYETGGILVGTRTAEHIFILAVVDAGPKSLEKRTMFKKDFSYAKSELARLHTESQGKWGYLGEWHSHPDGSLMPSSVDVKSMNDIVKSILNSNLTPILLIGDIRKGGLEFQIYNTSLKRGLVPMPVHYIIVG
jgi:integrative and conjugative element protein (TIGR02256 family)